MLPLNSNDFVDISLYETTFPLRVDLVYAQANHLRNLFNEAIYHPQAKLWSHKDIAAIMLLAAKRLHEQSGLFFSAKDSLRTTTAQERMQDTDIVRKNPHWCQEPNRLLSPPGKGAHPRGMAIDITVQDENGREIDMGTPFDYLTEDPHHNPAARDYKNLDAEILQRRLFVENIVLQAAHDLKISLIGLAAEWWDYRVPADIYNQYAPLSDEDLPDEMKMVETPKTKGNPKREKAQEEIHLLLKPFLL